MVSETRLAIIYLSNQGFVDHILAGLRGRFSPDYRFFTKQDNVGGFRDGQHVIVEFSDVQIFVRSNFVPHPNMLAAMKGDLKLR